MVHRHDRCASCHVKLHDHEKENWMLGDRYCADCHRKHTGSVENRLSIHWCGTCNKYTSHKHCEICGKTQHTSKEH